MNTFYRIMQTSHNVQFRTCGEEEGIWMSPSRNNSFLNFYNCFDYIWTNSHSHTHNHSLTHRFPVKHISPFRANIDDVNKSDDDIGHFSLFPNMHLNIQTTWIRSVCMSCAKYVIVSMATKQAHRVVYAMFKMNDPLEQIFLSFSKFESYCIFHFIFLLDSCIHVSFV